MRTVLALVIVLTAAGCRRDPPPAAGPAAATPGAGATTAGSTTAGTTTAGSKSPAAGAVAAKPSPSEPEAPAKPIGTYEQSADGVTRMTISGLDLEVAADVPQRPKDAPTVVDGDNQVVITLRGWQIQARDGRLYVGGKSFGEAPAGSKVRITKAGVYVGGELRGPLP